MPPLPPKSRQRILIVGPGSIGCCIAGALASQGHELVFAARATFSELRLETPDGALSYAARCVSDPNDCGPLDALVLATKAHQTGAVAEWLRWATERGLPILVAQNGVDHLERIRAAVAGDGAAPGGSSARASTNPAPVIVPAVVYCAAHRHGPGHAVLEGAARLIVPDDEHGRRMAALFDGSFMRVDVSDDWTTAAWTKLLMNSSVGPLCALTGQAMDVLKDPDAAALVVSLIEEAIAVGRAEGARFPEGTAQQVVQRAIRSAGNHRPSIAQDRLAGLPTEWVARNEVIVRLGARHGIAVPLNAAMTTLLRLGEPG